MITKFVLLAIATTLSLGGCAYRPDEVADPAAITLRAAVLEVADTLAAAREHTAGRPKVGLIVDEATVVFNVSAKSTENSGLKVDTSLPASVGFPLALSSNYSLANEGNRGNQITLKFKNIATAKLTKKDVAIIADCNRPNPPGWCSHILQAPLPRDIKRRFNLE